MDKQILCNWRECRSVDAATREALRSAIEPGAVVAAVGTFFLEKSGTEAAELFPGGIPPRRLSGWEIACDALPASNDWRCMKFRCTLAGVDCDGERLRSTASAFAAALPAFWIVGPGESPVILVSLLPSAEPQFTAGTRAGRNVWLAKCPLCAAVLTVPGIELR